MQVYNLYLIYCSGRDTKDDYRLIKNLRSWDTSSNLSHNEIDSARRITNKLFSISLFQYIHKNSLSLNHLAYTAYHSSFILIFLTVLLQPNNNGFMMLLTVYYFNDFNTQLKNGMEALIMGSPNWQLEHIYTPPEIYD